MSHGLFNNFAAGFKCNCNFYWLLLCTRRTNSNWVIWSLCRSKWNWC